MRPMRFWSFIVLFVPVLSSCSKDTSDTCDVSTTPTTAGVAESVSYSANKIGNASMSSLTYGGANGNVTVNNPTLPWSTTVTVPQGGNISIAATGKSSSGGGIAAGYSFQIPNGIQVQVDTCRH